MERDPLDSWFVYIHNDRDGFPDNWRRYLKRQPKVDTGYESASETLVGSGGVVVRDPNRSSIEPAAPGSGQSGDGAPGASSDTGSGSGPAPRSHRRRKENQKVIRHRVTRPRLGRLQGELTLSLRSDRPRSVIAWMVAFLRTCSSELQGMKRT
jgi:hypothetical protein